MRSLTVLEPGEVQLSHREATTSPCNSCQTSPCCQFLPLQTFGLLTLSDVDYALYLLNFDNIELGVAADGSWSAYYRQSCRFLEPDTFGCQLHGTPEKPHVCVQYNPFSCFYRKALGAGTGAVAAYLRIDRQRMRIVANSLVYDEDRTIVGAPTIESLAEAFVDLPLDDTVVAAAEPTTSAWVAATDPMDPCGSCAAHCCTTLMFPASPPAHVSSLDYLRFVLGFPGTEVVVVDDRWQVAVRTRCRHLDQGRCAVYGRDERPLRCGFYDAWTCGYRPVFDGNGAAPTVRLQLADFPVLAAACSFKPDGTAATLPGVEDLRTAVAAGRTAVASAVRPELGSAAMIRRLLPLTVVGGPAAARGA